MIAKQSFNNGSYLCKLILFYKYPIVAIQCMCWDDKEDSISKVSQIECSDFSYLLIIG